MTCSAASSHAAASPSRSPAAPGCRRCSTSRPRSRAPRRARARSRHEQAEEIAALCDADRYDVDGDRRGRGRDRQPRGRGRQGCSRPQTDAPVHKDATSQDAVDTAAMLVTKRALGRSSSTCAPTANVAADLAERAPRHADHRPHAAPAGQRRRRSASRPPAGRSASTRPPTACTALPLAYQLGGAGRHARPARTRSTSASTGRSSPGTRSATGSASSPARSASPPARSARPRST